MLERFFGKKIRDENESVSGPDSGAADDARPDMVDEDDSRPITEMSPEELGAEGLTGAELAAAMLRSPSALLQLTVEESLQVVEYMRPLRYAEGQTLIQEGDSATTGFLLLVVEGSVAVETIVVSRVQPSTVTVLGPGSLLGEVSLFDEGPRSATCTAVSEVKCAALTREALMQLLTDDPSTGAKLLLAVTLYMAKRLRDSGQKLRLYARLTQVMQAEINTLMR